MAFASLLGSLKEIIIYSGMKDDKGWTLMRKVVLFLLLQKKLFISTKTALFTVLGHVLVFVILIISITKDDPNGVWLTVVWSIYTLIVVLQASSTAWLLKFLKPVRDSFCQCVDDSDDFVRI